tara:strand:+ start:867 stop:989 length:123 start_codon:yes stop_codon:yes gene_type:complete
MIVRKQQQINLSFITTLAFGSGDIVNRLILLAVAGTMMVM